jgi:hypothetical protein
MGENPASHPITREWYGKAEEYQPKPGRKYDWVWDYAKFRFGLASDNQRYIENKIVTTFKLLLAVLAGYGTVFSFFVSQHVTLSKSAYGLGMASIVALVLSAVLLWKGFNPLDHLYPIKEEAALWCIDDHDEQQDCRANMSLAMTATIEVERQAASVKARWLTYGCWALGLSALLFIFALASEVHQ